MAAPGQRRVGRRIFLAILAGGGVVAAGGAQAFGALGKLPVIKSFVPQDGFYFYTVSSTEPSFDGTNWPLRIEGLVENPMTITFHSLLGLAQSDQVHDYMCVTGWKVDRVRWQGPLVSQLLDMARPKASARAVSFDSADGIYVDSLTLDEARRPAVVDRLQPVVNVTRAALVGLAGLLAAAALAGHFVDPSAVGDAA